MIPGTVTLAEFTPHELATPPGCLEALPHLLPHAPLTVSHPLLALASPVSASLPYFVYVNPVICSWPRVPICRLAVPDESGAGKPGRSEPCRPARWRGAPPRPRFGYSLTPPTSHTTSPPSIPSPQPSPCLAFPPSSSTPAPSFPPSDWVSPQPRPNLGGATGVTRQAVANFSPPSPTLSARRRRRYLAVRSWSSRQGSRDRHQGWLPPH